MNMHEISCARNNYTCLTCNSIIRPSEKIKHEALVHTPLYCPLNCGKLVLQNEMSYHRQFECENRSVSCRYCPLSFLQSEIIWHQNKCMLRITTCLHCNINLKAQGLF